MSRPRIAELLNEYADRLCALSRARHSGLRAKAAECRELAAELEREERPAVEPTCDCHVKQIACLHWMKRKPPAQPAPERERSAGPVHADTCASHHDKLDDPWECDCGALDTTGQSRGHCGRCGRRKGDDADFNDAMRTSQPVGDVCFNSDTCTRPAAVGGEEKNR